MKCYYNNKENQIEANIDIEKQIYKIIKNFHILINESFGLDANSDNGIQDMHYTKDYEELVFENFIIDENKIIGYDYDGKFVAFDGTEEKLIYSWDDSVYGGSTDNIDKGYVKIIKKTNK